MKKFARKTLITLILSAALCFAGCSGCAFIDNFFNTLTSGYSVYFTNSDICLDKGETLKIGYDDLMFVDLSEDRDAESIEYSLSTADSAVVKAAGKTIQAMSPGTAKVTLTTEDGVNAYLNITVSASVKSLSLVFPSGRLLPYNSAAAVDVYAVINGGELPASYYDIRWSINGESVGFYGNPLTLYKSGSAEVYSIGAAVYDEGVRFEASASAGYYAANIGLQNNAVVSSKTVANTGESILLALDEPFDYAEWYINDTFVSEGAEITFTPDEAGYYDVYAVCAGVATPELRLTVRGAVSPRGIRADYDDTYPLLQVSWQGADGIACLVSATPYGDEAGATISMVSSKGNAVLSVDASLDYEITVSAVEDENFTAGDVPAAVQIAAVSEIERYYLEKTYFGGNYYITDDEEFFEFFDYMMYFREQPQNGKTTLSSERVYLAYDYGDYDDLLGRAFDYSGITGSYNIGGEVTNRVAAVYMEFFTVNTPSRMSGYDSRYHYDALDAFPVHWNAGGDKIKYFSASEKGKVEVTTTDQMFRVAEKGYVPLPVTGSSADKVYEYAEYVLNSILSADMDDMERVRAIYEYIMYKTTYDGSVIDYDIDDSVKSASFYMESILIDGDSFGVCDAMSKTMSFLCNMANVRAMRIVGYAGTGDEKGGHAWNKVCVDGSWYIVDPTWGDAKLRIRTKAGFSYDTQYLESAGHSYFLLTDADVAATHVAYTADCPATSPVPYNYYAHETLGEEFGLQPMYLQSHGDALRLEMENIAAYIAENTAESHTYSAYGIDRTSVYYGYEFSVCSRSLTEAENIVTGRTKSDFYTLLDRAGLGYNVFADGNSFYVIVSRGELLYDSMPAAGETPQRPFWWWLW